MTNPLTSREAPDPMTLTGFSKRSQSEIDHNLFAAKTGGLVAISAPSFWEMYVAAKAWHAHAAAQRKREPCGPCIGTGKNIMHGHDCTHCGGKGSVPQ